MRAFSRVYDFRYRFADYFYGKRVYITRGKIALRLKCGYFKIRVIRAHLTDLFKKINNEVDLNSWIISIGIALLLTTFVTVLLPKGKSAKFIKGVSTVIVMLVVLKPFSVLKNGGELPFFSFDKKVGVDENYVSYAIEKSVENKKKAVKKICEEYGFSKSEVEIFYETDEYYATEIIEICVFVDFDAIDSTANEKNVIEKIKEDVCLALSVSDEKMHIYDKNL